MSNVRPVMAFRPKRTQQSGQAARKLRKSSCEHVQPKEPEAKEFYVSELVELADEMDGSLLLDNSGYLSGAVMGDAQISPQTQRLDPSENSIHGWSGQLKLAHQSNRNLGVFSYLASNQNNSEMDVNPSRNMVLNTESKGLKYHGATYHRSKESDEGFSGFKSTNNFFLAANPHLNTSTYPQKLLSWFSTSTNSSDPKAIRNLGKASDQSKIRSRLVFHQKSKQITRSGVFFGRDSNPLHKSGDQEGDPAEPLSIRRVLSNSSSRESLALEKLMAVQELVACDSARGKDPRPPTLGFVQNQRGYISFTNFRKKSASRLDSRIEVRTPQTNLVQSGSKKHQVVSNSQNPEGTGETNKHRSADLAFHLKGQYSKFGSQDNCSNQYIHKPASGMLNGRLVSAATKPNPGVNGEQHLTLNNTYLVPTGTRLNSSSCLSRYRIQQKPQKLLNKPSGPTQPCRQLSLGRSSNLSFEVKVSSACRPPSSQINSGITAASAQAKLYRSHSVGWLKPSAPKTYF